VIILLGKRLQKGDTIGLISPAGPIKKEDIYESTTILKKLGFNIKKGRHIYDKWGYLAGKDKDRAYDLMDMFCDKTVDMILCTRGGYGTMRILPFINFNLIKQNPKIFAGFSDITALLNTIYLKCNITTFHAPMCNSNLNDKVTIENFLRILTSGYNPLKIKNTPPNPKFKGYFSDSSYFNGNRAKGTLVGGNLSLISGTIGTPYEIDTKDKILFLEDVNEEPYKIDKMLTQMALCGKLEECNGIILGHFTSCSLPNYERSLTLEEVLNDRIISLGKPTIVNFQCGHSYPRLTIPIGAQVEIDCPNSTVNILEPMVK
jgi:muramoyltetrapeptide carboxypeptidase